MIMWAIKLNPAKLFGLQAPAKQSMPNVTQADLIKSMKLAFCAAGAHAATVFALGGDPLFGQIVKAAEPVLAAIVGTVFYNKAPTFYKVCCLPIIVGGVAFASLKKGGDGSYSLKFDVTALVFGMLANAFAAFKGGENSKLMADKGIAERYGGVGNQVSVTQVTIHVVYKQCFHSTHVMLMCSSFYCLYSLL
jgi:solute carrier family 35 protein E1